MMLRGMLYLALFSCIRGVGWNDYLLRWAGQNGFGN